jgi:hypothetical protein
MGYWHGSLLFGRELVTNVAHSTQRGCGVGVRATGSILPIQEAIMNEISLCQLDGVERKSPVRVGINPHVALRIDCAAGGRR